MSHVSLGHLCTASPSLPSTAKFTLGPIYMHNTNAADRTDQPNSVVFTRWNILPRWNDGGRLISPPVCSLCILRPRFWMIHTDSGTEAPTDCHNLSERTQSRPWLRSEVFSLLTTDVRSCRLADVSFTQLGTMNSLKSYEQCNSTRAKKKKKINVAWQLFTCLLNKPYQNSTFMKADVAKQRLYTEQPSLKRCFDIWI